MSPRLPILLSVALLAAAILLVFRNELHARGPHGLNRLSEPVKQCGFWGSMEGGMSCRGPATTPKRPGAPVNQAKCFKVIFQRDPLPPLDSRNKNGTLFALCSHSQEAGVLKV